MINNTLDKTVGMLQVLTDKLSGINNKAKDNVLLNQEYEDLNNKLDILFAMFNSNSNESGIVGLLNLPRPISEYTNAHVGETILIPYNDESGKIALNNGCIEFEVVGVNHHKDVNDENKPTITLMTKNIIRAAAFDAREPRNPAYDEYWDQPARVAYGNNRWSVSNIRQWLNSEGAANEWFTPQHEYDEAPTVDKVAFGYEAGAYADDPGFLVGFSNDVKQHFATVRNKTILGNVDKLELSKDFEETEDKVFLLSRTEIGLGDRDSSNPEGSHLSKRFPDIESRKKTGASEYYWLRTPEGGNKITNPWLISNTGAGITSAAFSMQGITPIIVIY